MFAHDLHVALASVTLVGFTAVAVEGGVRAVHGHDPGRAARAGLNVAVVLVGMTAAAGLAMLVRDERPREWLHVLYAFLAFGMVPAMDSMALRAGARVQGWARFAGAVVALAVVAASTVSGPSRRWPRASSCGTSASRPAVGVTSLNVGPDRTNEGRRTWILGESDGSSAGCS